MIALPASGKLPRENNAMPVDRNKLSRRRVLAGTGAAGLAMVGFPNIVRAQAKEVVVGGPAGVATWAELYDAKYKGRLVLPSLQNTEGLANLVMAAHLETGKPIADAQFDIDAGFKKIKTLKPNILTIYTQIPQAFNLLE